MIKKVLLTAVAALAIVAAFLWALSAIVGVQSGSARVIGFGENIVLITPIGEKQIAARIDTGADFSSIDTELALSLGYKPDSTRRKTIRTELGVEQRDVVDIKYRLAGREIASEATVADRSSLSTRMIVGRADLSGFLVDPSEEFLGGARKGPPPGIVVVGALERIQLHSPAGNIEISARVDSGSEFSAIDRAFAMAVGLEPDENRKRTISTTRGAVDLPTVESGLTLGTAEVASTATVADRAALTHRMLLGREDLKGFLIDPAREFVVSGASDATPLSSIPFLRLQSAGVARIIIIIPMLGAVVVLLKLLAGVRTFGIFGPVVIALSILSLRIIPGLAVYVSLLTAGIAMKLLVLDRLKLAHMSEFSLIMFVLVLALVGVTTFPLGLTLSFTDVFFPLIITSHLIEQASRSMEEHSLGEFVPVMVFTLISSVALAYYASFLIEQPSSVLWAIFILSMLAVIVAGYYSGLRLSELVRFRFLKRTHVHE